MMKIKLQIYTEISSHLYLDWHDYSWLTTFSATFSEPCLYFHIKFTENLYVVLWSAMQNTGTTNWCWGDMCQNFMYSFLNMTMVGDIKHWERQEVTYLVFSEHSGENLPECHAWGWLDNDQQPHKCKTCPGVGSIYYPTLGCNIQGFRAMGLSVQYWPLWFEDFPAIWLAVPFGTNGAHLGICTLPKKSSLCVK